MSTTELKKRIYKELESADDYLLEEILGLIQCENENQERIDIPNHYKEALDKSIAQIQSGDVISNKEVQEKIKKWLYK